MKWDVKKEDEITFFDPDLSYELTGYRPITKTQGLDFKPEWFNEDAQVKLSRGKYSGLLEGTKSHRDWWIERIRRCIEGYESNGYRITGDNYFWLNFYRLKQSKKGAKASAGRDVSFPAFFTYQYEYFHYLEICEIIGKDVGLLKSRGIGFSEIAASLCARPFITTPHYRVVASAFSEKHLKPLLTKIWSQLNWLNVNTEGAFRRVRMMHDTGMHKKASKKKKDGSEDPTSHMSEIEGIVADVASKIRGDRTERLFYEEAGSDKLFKKKWVQGEALINVMEEKVGTRIGWGTGGDEGVAVEGIRDMVNKPSAWDILPYKNDHTPDGRTIYTAMFIPCYRTVMSLVDGRGYCDWKAGKEYYDKKRAAKVDDPKSLLMYKAEFCFTIEEALSGQGDNIFPREELAEQVAQMDIYKSVPTPKAGHLLWKRDTDGRNEGVKWKHDNEQGKILILEHPLFNEEGYEYKNLYIGGIDSIDIGKKDSANPDSNKLSDFCIVIKKRVFGQSEPMYVAIYKDRPRDVREAYENAAKLLTYYGCQAVLESTRTAILTHFRNQKYMHLLMKRPRSTLSDIRRGNSNMYGAPASIKTIDHYRELIYDFCLDYTHTICFREMLSQLLEYSDERKKDFDIIAAMGFCELGDEEISAKKPEPREPLGKGFRDIGWYKDSRGYKHYGVIPQTDEERNERTRTNSRDSWLYDEFV